jgi:hypothetical protein
MVCPNAMATKHAGCNGTAFGVPMTWRWILRHPRLACHPVGSVIPPRSSLKEWGLSSRLGWSEGVVRWPLACCLGAPGRGSRVKARPQAAGEAAGGLDLDAAWCGLVDAEEGAG